MIILFLFKVFNHLLTFIKKVISSFYHGLFSLLFHFICDHFVILRLSCTGSLSYIIRCLSHSILILGLLWLLWVLRKCWILLLLIGCWLRGLLWWDIVLLLSLCLRYCSICWLLLTIFSCIKFSEFPE